MSKATNTTTSAKATTNTTTNKKADAQVKAQAKAEAKVNSEKAFLAYTALCKQAQQAGQVHARSAYATQKLLLEGKAVTADQQKLYDDFVALVQQAQAACIAVKGKESTCGVFNYLDGRETGHKVATGLGNSTDIRTFIANIAKVSAKLADAVTSKATTPAKVQA